MWIVKSRRWPFTVIRRNYLHFHELRCWKSGFCISGDCFLFLYVFWPSEQKQPVYERYLCNLVCLYCLALICSRLWCKKSRFFWRKYFIFEIEHKAEWNAFALHSKWTWSDLCIAVNSVVLCDLRLDFNLKMLEMNKQFHKMYLNAKLVRLRFRFVHLLAANLRHKMGIAHFICFTLHFN